MILFYVFLFLLFLFDTRPVFTGTRSNERYLSKATCASIKGFCVVLVFLAHGSTYIEKMSGGVHLYGK